MATVQYILCVSLIFTALTHRTSAQCPPTEVLFLIDESENALQASSTNSVTSRFDLLRNSVTNFLNHPRIRGSTNDFRAGIISYSSGNDVITSVPPGSSLQQALAGVNGIGRVQNAGSWTYNGLRAVTNSPVIRTNQRIIVVSSQGSGDPTRRELAAAWAQRVVQQLGWTPYVIGAQGDNPLDLQELTTVNAGRNPVILNDPAVNPLVGPQGYKFLAGAFNTLIENELCPVVVTQPPPPPVTPPPQQSGICNDCLFEAGYDYDFDPVYCDSYYVCVPGQAPMRQNCPAGTFWSGNVCDFIKDVNCAVGTCIASTPAGTRYPSGRCCNKYFQCANSQLNETDCPQGQVYDTQRRICMTVTDTRPFCENLNRFVCDVAIADRQGGVAGCVDYSPDPFGDPCKFVFSGQTFDTPPGSIWDQATCNFVQASNQCLTRAGSASSFFGAAPAPQCSATFLSTFDNGNAEAFSERQNQNLGVSVTVQTARLQNNGLQFDANMARAYGYYFFFNNRAIRENTAFRLRFRIDGNNAQGAPMDLLSNNFCDLCPETVSITAASRGGNQVDVRATFGLTDNRRVTTAATIGMQNPQDELEVIVIVGPTSVFGQVTEIQGNNPLAPVQTVNFNPAAKSSGVEVQPNRCGFMLGQGPNSNFVGLIDDFAVFEYCQDIQQVLRR